MTQPDPLHKRSLAGMLKSWMRRALVLIAVIALCGCGREDLYTNVTESDANTMLGLLIARGISATKRPVKENLFAVAVPREQFASAVDILKWYGIPKETFQGIGEMFPKTGLVSSPSEERIRFMHALAGNISEMLSNIDGVIIARVILVLPSNDPYTNSSYPASASVFLKIRPGFDVMNSVEGLKYEHVAVTLVRSDEVDFFNPLKLSDATVSFLGIKIPAKSIWIFYTLSGLVGILVVVIVGGGVYLLIRLRREAKAEAKAEASANEVLPAP